MQEVWKPVTRFEGLYEVSSNGRVRSLDREVRHRWGGIAIKRGKNLKGREDKNGYLFVSLCTDGVSISAKLHRLVAEHFLPPSSFPEVNHKDFIKANNAATNLEWVTRKGNQEHRAKKLTPEMASEIRASRETGMTFKAIAEKFGISAPTALKVTRGEIWN